MFFPLVALVITMDQAMAPKPAELSPAARIAVAVESANVDDIRVLVVWESTDARSKQFAELWPEPVVMQTRYSADEYRLVKIDVGAADNAALAAKYGAKISMTALPMLTVLDQHGKVVVQGASADFETGGSFQPAKLAAFLVKNQAPAPDAVAQFDAGMKQAKNDGKTAFLWWSAPWCSWCHKLGSWMALADVQPLLAKAFTDIKLDFDRGIGAKDIQHRYTNKEQGLPWFVFLDVTGKAIADSSDPKTGNVGCPWQPNEIAYFKTMLDKVATTTHKLSDADVAFLIKSLEEFKRKVEGS